MQDTLTRYLAGFPQERERAYLRAILAPVLDRFSTRALTNSTLVIKTGGSALAKTGAADSYFTVQGVPVKVAASTDQAALSGTVVNATFNVFCFYVDSAGALTSAMGTAGATLGAARFPVPPEGKCLVGFVIINPTGSGNFVGGTTALDDGTVVPNAVYVSPVGPFDPSVLL
jgi:hypothetical protein